jgi:predicted glycoside hydrolase/deacetylase ChbG (UPF0249 family)
MGTVSKGLIVNADDYGYFPFVTAGILEGIDEGIITATGILANSDTFSRDVRSLRQRPQVDVGVHLNLTWGEPVTAAMRRCLSRNGGRFADKWRTIAMLAGSGEARQSAREEIAAQVSRCLDEGLQVRFLNAHEHLHLLPLVGTAVQSVAKSLGIRYIRRSGSERAAGVSGVSPGWRGRLLDALALMQRSTAPDQPRLLGLGCSGSLTSDYLAAVLPQLAGGSTYELMCHPGGKLTPGAEVPRRLQAYHDWLGEKSLLFGSEFRELLARFDIELIRFRDLREEAIS